MRGVVKEWKLNGFGFIAVAGLPDVWVHYSALTPRELVRLNRNDVVEFDLVQSARGPQAAFVKVLGGKEAERALAAHRVATHAPPERTHPGTRRFGPSGGESPRVEPIKPPERYTGGARAAWGSGAIGRAERLVAGQPDWWNHPPLPEQEKTDP